MGSSRDGIGMVADEPEGGRFDLGGLGDLRVALGPFHEDHSSARLEAVDHPLKRFRDRRHRPCDYRATFR